MTVPSRPSSDGGWDWGYEKIGDAFGEIRVEPLNKGDHFGCGSSLKGACASTVWSTPHSIPAVAEHKNGNEGISFVI